MSRRVLLIDDDSELCTWLKELLGRRQFVASYRTSAEEALELLRDEEFDVVITDLNLGRMNGLTLCQRIAENRPNLPVIVYTAFGNLQNAVSAIRSGAYDFVTKESDEEQLLLALERAAQHRALREEVQRLRQTVAAAQGFEEFIGKSAAMRTVFERMEKIARADHTVLLTGETGTGKELAARAIHRRSARANEPFLPVNCSTLTEALADAELFGHVRGAFTGAVGSKGIFLEAGRGTVFLDEIGDLPLQLQPKLLRAFQEQKIRLVGTATEVPFEARIIAATNRDLESAVEDHRFRSDLYFRLNRLGLELPPLRSRGQDILLLAQHFLSRSAAVEGRAIEGLSPPVAGRLLSYRWPGNLRELQNCIEHAVSRANHSKILLEDLPPRIQGDSGAVVLSAGHDPAELVTLKQVENNYIRHVLDVVGGDKTRAARILGIDRKTIYRKFKDDEGTSG